MVDSSNLQDLWRRTNYKKIMVNSTNLQDRRTRTDKKKLLAVEENIRVTNAFVEQITNGMEKRYIVKKKTAQNKHQETRIGGSMTVVA